MPMRKRCMDTRVVVSDAAPRVTPHLYTAVTSPPAFCAEIFTAGSDEQFGEEILHRLPAAPVGARLISEAGVRADAFQLDIGEGMAGIAISVDLPVGAAFGQLAAERDHRVGRSDRVFPAVADE